MQLVRNSILKCYHYFLLLMHHLITLPETLNITLKPVKKAQHLKTET